MKIKKDNAILLIILPISLCYI